MNRTYTVGLDFGTRSMRALLVDPENGEEMGYKEYPYPHGIMADSLPDGTKLGPDWALQHPADYFSALQETVPKLLEEYGVKGESVLAVCVDFTSSTVLPLDGDLVPLCLLPEFEKEPHAYVKLWKHHAAKECARRMTELARENGEPWLARIGGTVSSEFAFPKMLETYLDAPKVFERAEYFMDAGDYLVSCLTGKVTRSTCIAGYKYFRSREDGFPSERFLNRLEPDFGTKVLKKLQGTFLAPGTMAGRLTKEYAEKLGLSENTVVASAVIDAHAAIPSAGEISENAMLMILGTSGCYHLLSKSYREAEGIFGVVKDGMIDGFYCYEAGQSGVGDLFEWLSRTCVTKELEDKANQAGLGVLDYLAALAAKKKVGETGLLCLDWFNGNRSILNDSDLSGVILGLTLSTKTEDIYRALVEAVAFGTRKIVDNFNDSGIPVDVLYATGSLAKAPFVMQTFADVLGKEIRIVSSQNGSALGTAIFAAAASGKYTLKEAVEKLGKTQSEFYRPNFEDQRLYDVLYREYSKLHDYFGREVNPVLKTLKSLRK